MAYQPYSRDKHGQIIHTQSGCPINDVLPRLNQLTLEVQYFREEAYRNGCRYRELLARIVDLGDGPHGAAIKKLLLENMNEI